MEDDKTFLQNLKIKFPQLENRVKKLEEIEETRRDIKMRVESLEKKFETVGKKVDDFCKEMRISYADFIEKVRAANSSFIKWLIGVVFTSLISGLIVMATIFYQFNKDIETKFHIANESQHEHKEEMIKEIGQLRVIIESLKK